MPSIPFSQPGALPFHPCPCNSSCPCISRGTWCPLVPGETHHHVLPPMSILLHLHGQHWHKHSHICHNVPGEPRNILLLQSSGLVMHHLVRKTRQRADRSAAPSRTSVLCMHTSQILWCPCSPLSTSNMSTLTWGKQPCNPARRRSLFSSACIFHPGIIREKNVKP